MKVLGILGGVIVILLLITWSTYNNLQTRDEQVAAAWSEVLNQYQRRADLVPNLVNAVKGYAAHEKDVFMQVTEARAKIGSIKVNAAQLADEKTLSEFQAAQGEMKSALSRLLAVAENYPALKADANFRDLQAQLEGTENRITVARGRYIKSVQDFNTLVRRFPANFIAEFFGMHRKPNFSVENEKELSTAPAVNF